MIKKILLVEIGIEELPARLLSKISICFYENFAAELKYYHISYEEIQLFSTPRRLALKISHIHITNKTTKINKKGPAVIDAYDQNGLPTEAANRWAQSCGIDLNQAHNIKTKKGEWLFYHAQVKQEKLEKLLPKITEKTLKNIIIEKPMKWHNKDEMFCRPIRNIVIMLDCQIIQCKIFNVFSTNVLYNHIAFQENQIKIIDSKEYPLILFNTNNIIADHTLRKKIIIKQATKIAQKIRGRINYRDSLIEEITSLVESPTAMMANFDKKFLKIPKKILIYVIEQQQKCLPIYDKTNNILPYFIFIANINSKKPHQVITGNEKVMHSRLSDAAFFFKKDRKIKLEDHIFSLKKVLFQYNLGSLYDKTLRLQLLIEWISKYTNCDIQDSIRAAYLSKCDLVTDMVCEFPALQGTVGMYYALENKEKTDISLALKEQYLPSYSGDKLPCTMIGCSLSIADKMDTLSGMFCIGKIPSSNKDPFALRRLSIAILRIIINKKIPINLKNLINKSLDIYGSKYLKNCTLYNKILKFFMTRLIYWYEEKGYDIKVINSVISCESTQLIEIDQKIQAIDLFKKSDYSRSIILSIKRISNILEKEETHTTRHFDIKLIEKIEEEILFTHIQQFHINTKNLFKEHKYKIILLKTKDLEKPIRQFFNKVRIHDSNICIRINRLILLKKIKNIFMKIANFSYLF